MVGLTDTTEKIDSENDHDSQESIRSIETLDLVMSGSKTEVKSEAVARQAKVTDALCPNFDTSIKSQPM